jgi:PKD domain
VAVSPRLARSRRHGVVSRARWAIRTVAALGATGACLLIPSAAGALVSEVGEAKVGLQPRNDVTIGEGNPKTFKNTTGSPVVHSAHTIAIYWDPSDRYHGEEQEVINTYLGQMGFENGSFGTVFAVNSQYTDKTNAPAARGSTFLGAYTDTDPYPAKGCEDPEPLITSEAELTCITDAQVRAEISAFIASNGLPKGMGTIYNVLTPQGVAVCLDGGGASGHCSTYEANESEEQTGEFTTASYAQSFCSYHADISPTNPVEGDGNTILYDVVPWVAGGYGNYRLAEHDFFKVAYPCQDGVSIQEPNQLPAKFVGPDGTFDHGLADVIINQLAVEQQNTVTDPLLNAWQDGTRHESTDECRNHFGSLAGLTQMSGSAAPVEFTLAGTLANTKLSVGGLYYLNNAFNLAGILLPYPGVPCMGAVNLVPSFNFTNVVNAGETVALDGMQSDITLNASKAFSEGHEVANYAKYSWNFGDGTPIVSGYAPGAPTCSAPWLSPCAASEFHSFQYGGTYNVTLTVTDTGGNVASVTQPIVVRGPSAPSGAGGGSGNGSGSSAPTPVITEFVLSRSLRKVLRRGLSVHYSVSEQVGGHFEVLIATSLARRLHISGASATGLAAGTPPQTVIGKAILATTHGGVGTLTIQMGPKTVRRLRHMHKLTLIVRMLVHNSHAKTAAATATVTLAR